jgi:hypothetical protein
MNQSIKIQQPAETCVNDMATSCQIDTKLARDCSLPVLVTALARARIGHPQRDRIVVLIGQCKNYGKYPGMGARILETIEQIETRSAQLHAEDQ